MKRSGRFRAVDTLVNNAGLFNSFYFDDAEETTGFQSIMVSPTRTRVLVLNGRLDLLLCGRLDRFTIWSVDHHP